MKLKEHPDFPKKKIPLSWSEAKGLNLSGSEVMERQQYNDLLDKLGEIDLNELIDEEKVTDVLQKHLWMSVPRKPIRDKLAKAIKSSNIWKDKK